MIKLLILYKLKEIKKPTLLMHRWAFVGAARFELATSWSQTRRDNRATLRPVPDLQLFIEISLKILGCKNKGYRDNRKNDSVIRI